MPRVVVTVDETDDEALAVAMVSNMLNGCYPPGEIVYPCQSYREVVAKSVARRIRDTKARKRGM